MDIRQINDEYSVAAQITAEEVKEIKEPKASRNLLP
jgi:protein tyrosine phosphatase (PTP) superfamily phosphohydrolase (DUF442 family)